MSSNKGSSAFPVVGMSQWGEQPVSIVLERGMTLRDYFAAQAMTAMLCADTDNGRFRDRGTSNRTAIFAYSVADAMLKAREPEAQA